MKTATQQRDLEKLQQAQKLLAVGDFIGARAVFAEVAANAPDSYQKIVRSGRRLHYEFWDEDEFESYLEYHASQGECCEVTGSQSIYPKAIYGLAFLEIEDANLDAAVDYLMQTLRMEPDQPSCYTELASIFVAQGNHEDALAAYKRAFTVRPYHSPHLKAVILRGMGFQYIELGDLDKAECLFRESLKLDPNNSLAQNEVIYIAQLRDGGQRAKASLKGLGQQPSPQFPICCHCGKKLVVSRDRFSIIDQNNHRYYVCAPCEVILRKAQDLRERGDKAFESGDYQAAIKSYSAALELNPKDGRTLCNRALCYMNVGLHELAISDNSHAIELAADEAIPYYNRGISRYEMGEPDKALADFSRSLELSPNIPETHVWKGLCFDALQDQDAAVREYSRAIEIKPEYSWAYHKRALVYLSNGQFDLAYQDANQVVSLQPHHAEAYFLRGRIFEQAGRLEQALADFERAVSLDPATKKYRHFLAGSYHNNDRLNDALQILDGLVEDYADEDPPVEVFTARGKIYLALGEYALALADFERARTIQESMHVHECLGTAHFFLEHYEEAIKHFTVVVENDPESADFLSIRAKAYECLARYEEALQDLTKFMIIYPENLDIHIRRADCCFELGLLGDAIVDYQKVIDLDPTYSMAYFGCAVSHGELGEYEAAYELLERAKRLEPGSSAPYIINAGFLANQERFDEALCEIDIARQMEPDNPDIENVRIQIIEERDQVFGCN